MPTSRRSLKLSLPPLWLMGVCLFLPAVRSCEKLVSPAQLLSDSKPLFAMMLSPYVVAQLLVIVAVVALARGRVTPFATWATALLAGITASSAVVMVGMPDGTICPRICRSCWPSSRSSAAQSCSCARGVPTSGRAILRLHAAYTIFTLPMAVLLARIVIGDGPRRVGVGAWLFLVAYAALVAVQLLSWRRDRLRL